MPYRAFLPSGRVLPALLALFHFLVLPGFVQAQVRDGSLRIKAGQLKVGQIIDLSGDWLYKPGYEIGAAENPEVARPMPGFRKVAVPQLLNRIHWWLDDSEDFKKREDERLKRLGFDTDKAEDGWYRLAVECPHLEKGQRLFLEFEGVAMRCKVFCNGTLLGSHEGMFSRFDFDLTPALKPGANLIAMFVSMEKIPPSSLAMGEAVTVNLTASKVRSMSKGMYGPLSPGFNNRDYDLHGIWQPARLVVRGGGRLDDVWFVPSLNGAELRIQSSTAGAAADAVIKATLTDAKTRRPFAEFPAARLTLASAPKPSVLLLRDVQPRLWTPADPNLYRLNVRLESPRGELLDSYSHEVGFRTFEVRSNQFFLNGHRYWLRGANHLPYGKNPWDPELPKQLVRLLHDGNVRITRTHATPWNENWLKVADEIGLAVSMEGIRPWALAGKIGATPADLFQHWLMENEDVIKRCRNHPSVFIHTVGNEMMLRDTKNPEKWQQLSEVVKQVRRLDPTRPVICSSEYQRDQETFESLIKPNQLDDGDIDDVHRYNNWYSASAFVTESALTGDTGKNQGGRPLIGQEMSSGYPDLDTGLPVLRYTRDLLTPQAWVGHFAYPGNDPAIFLEHHRAVTKRWAERLRYERGDKTAGFMLFATECWFAHSYDSKQVRPYPVYEAMREAWAPVGLAWEHSRRRFYAEEEIDTALFVTNDDEQFRDFADLRIEVAFAKMSQLAAAVNLDRLAYYETSKVPLRLRMPSSTRPRETIKLLAQLSQGKRQVGLMGEPVEIFSREKPEPGIKAEAIALGLGPNLSELAQAIYASTTTTATMKDTRASVFLLASNQAAELAADKPLRQQVEAGATAIVFSPGEQFNRLFPKEIMDRKAGQAEFGDFLPIQGTALVKGLRPMDLKWWGRRNDARLFIASQSHRLTPVGQGRELVRFIPPHSYIGADKLPEQYRTVLFEIPLGRGRLWVCDLDLEQCATIDPVAGIFAANLMRAAGAPDSTRHLQPFPSHEEMLKANLRSRR